jgi:hypothetical protein
MRFTLDAVERIRAPPAVADESLAPAIAADTLSQIEKNSGQAPSCPGDSFCSARRTQAGLFVVVSA